MKPKSGITFEVSRCNIAGAIQHILRQRPLVCEKFMQRDIKGFQIVGTRDGVIDEHIFILPDSVGPVGCLIFLCWVPRARLVDNVVCTLDIHAKSNTQFPKANRKAA